MKWMKLYLLYLLFKYLLFWCSQRLSHCSSFVLYFCLILSTIESEKLLLEIGDRIWMELYLFYLLFKYLLFWCSQSISHCSSFVLYFCLILSTIESEKLLLEKFNINLIELYSFYLLFKYLFLILYNSKTI
jgi:hypothetical protein